MGREVLQVEEQETQTVGSEPPPQLERLDFKDVLLKVCGDDDSNIDTMNLIGKLKQAGFNLYGDVRLRPFVDKLLIKKVGSGENIYHDLNIRRHMGIEELSELPLECIDLLKRTLFGKTVIPEFERLTHELQDMFNKVSNNSEGEIPAFIPHKHYNHWGISICTVDGQMWSYGDAKVPTTIQSCSAAFNYAIAITQFGRDHVHQYVGKEAAPSSRTDDIALDRNDRPHNAIIQSGAMSITSLLLQDEPYLPRCFEKLTATYEKLAGSIPLKINNTVYLADKARCDRKFSIAYLLKEFNVFPPDSKLKNIIDMYFQLNSLEVTCETGSIMAGTFANGGVCPVTQEKVLSHTAVQNALSIMQLQGLYGYSGEWMFEIGIPAKSCRSGTILVVVPGIMGICLYSPPLDKKSNSCRGVEFAHRLSQRYALHFLDNHISIPTKESVLVRKETHESKEHIVMNMMYAAAHGDINLLTRYSDIGVDMNQSDYDMRTALHLAACNNHLNVVKYLVEQKVEVCPLDRWNRTPLDDALKYGHEDLVLYLKKIGAYEGPGLIIIETEE